MTVDEYHSKVTDLNVHETEKAEEQVSTEYSLIKEAVNKINTLKETSYFKIISMISS